MLLVPHSAEPPTDLRRRLGACAGSRRLCRPVAAGCRTRADDRAAPRLDRDRCPARRRSMVRAGLGRLGRGGSASAERRDGRRTLPGAAAPPSRVGGADRTPRLHRSSRPRCQPSMSWLPSSASARLSCGIRFLTGTAGATAPTTSFWCGLSRSWCAGCRRDTCSPWSPAAMAVGALVVSRLAHSGGSVRQVVLPAVAGSASPSPSPSPRERSSSTAPRIP